MGKINVVQPFKVQFARGQEIREFALGEHELTADELQHWFVQGCIKEGRAVVLAEPAAKTEAPAKAEHAAKTEAPAKTKAPAKK